MLQRKAQNQRVTGNENDGQRQHHPRARKNAVVFCHDFHPLAERVEITHSQNDQLFLPARFVTL